MTCRAGRLGIHVHGDKIGRTDANKPIRLFQIKIGDFIPFI
jgi:hypothetical protein